MYVDRPAGTLQSVPRCRRVLRHTDAHPHFPVHIHPGGPPPFICVIQLWFLSDSVSVVAIHTHTHNTRHTKHHGNKPWIKLNVVACSAVDSSRFFSVKPPSSADVPPEFSSVSVPLSAQESPSSPLDSLQSLLLALPHLTGDLGYHELSPLEAFSLTHKYPLHQCV